MNCFEVISSYQKKGIISNKGADAFQACDDSSSYVASVLAYRVIISDGLLHYVLFYTLRSSNSFSCWLVLLQIEEYDN